MVAASRLNAATKRLETHCAKIHNQVEQFVDNYIKAVQEHRETLLKQIKQAKESELRALNERKLKLHQKIKDARDVTYFLDDLLSDGLDVEVLSFVKPVLGKIEGCQFEETAVLSDMGDNLHFLPMEKTQMGEFQVFGVVTTQTASPELSQLGIDGNAS